MEFGVAMPETCRKYFEDQRQRMLPGEATNNVNVNTDKEVEISNHMKQGPVRPESGTLSSSFMPCYCSTIHLSRKPERPTESPCIASRECPGDSKHFYTFCILLRPQHSTRLRGAGCPEMR